MPVSRRIVKKRSFYFDYMRLRFLYKLSIQSLEFSINEVEEYIILMEYFGREFPTSHFDIKTDYKKYSFIRYCRTNIRYKEIPFDMVVSFINIQENLN